MTICPEGSLVVFVGALDTTLINDAPYARRFLACVSERAIPFYSAGAVMDLFEGGAPRDIAAMAEGGHIVALGDAAAAACRAQGVVHECFLDPQTEDPAVWQTIEAQLDRLASRLPLDRRRYEAIRDRLFDLGYRAEWEWGQSAAPPATADDFAAQAIWVVCCSGFREQAARVTEAKVFRALHAGRSATEVFPKSGKGRAIDQLWANRERYFTELQAHMARGASAEEIIEWIEKAKLPFVGGGILRYHFAKNLGVDCAKPDLHRAPP